VADGVSLPTSMPTAKFCFYRGRVPTDERFDPVRDCTISPPIKYLLQVYELSICHTSSLRPSNLVLMKPPRVLRTGYAVYVRRNRPRFLVSVFTALVGIGE
jgi:hypothetical protein